MRPVIWVPGELKEDVGQQGGGGVSAREEDVNEFETEADGRAITFGEFIKEDVSAVWVCWERIFLLSGRV